MKERFRYVLNMLVAHAFLKVLVQSRFPLPNCINGGSYMSAHVLLNLLNDFGEKR